MITDNFKATIRSHWRDFYPADKHGGIICPICGNGSGTNGTGISVDKSSTRANSLHCMKCGFSGDIINLIALDKHWDNNKDFIKIVTFASERLKIEVNKSELAAIEAEAAHTPKNALVDYTDFFKIAAAGLEQTDYWKKRGLSLETVRHFNCGYLPRWRSPKVSVKIPCSPRFIIPIWKHGYLARDVRPIEEIADPKARRYIKQKAGTVDVFNASAIGESEILFAVEGEIDAMSIYEAGYHNVCALGSISMVRRFLAAIKNATKKPRAIIVALDNESAEPVKKARADLERGLAKLDIACLDGTELSGDKKDANELLTSNRTALKENCKRLTERAGSAKTAPKVELTLAEEELSKTTRQAIGDCPVDLLIPKGFIFNVRGISTEKYVPACLTPIVPLRVIANAKTGLEKMELAIRDVQGNWRVIATDMGNIADSSAIVKLSNVGIETFSGAGKHLTQFLMMMRAANRDKIPRVIEYDQPGWTPDRSEFILPYCSEQSLGALADRFTQSGSLEDWLKHADQIRNFDNQMARVCLDCAFTPPLLRLFGSRSFGVYIFGSSGYGKSAAMRFAISAWGDPNKMSATFNATQNSYERLAMNSNDLPMLIDEKQSTAAGDGTKFATIMYKLANEQDKGRMRRDTSLREFNHWRTLIMANGETQLFPESTTSGASNRVLEIALRDNDRIFPSEAEASKIHQFVDSNFGKAGEAFMKQLLPRVRNKIDGVSETYRLVRERLSKYDSEYMTEHISHLSKLIVGDMYVGQYLFNEAEPMRRSTEAILGEMLPRLPKRGELDDARRAWKQLRYFILSHQTSFVIKGEEASQATTKYSREVYGQIEMKKIEREGEDPDYELDKVMLFPEAAANALKSAGFDAKKCMNDFVDRGWIPFDGKGYPRVRWMGKRQRMIVIDGDKLSD